MARRHPKQCSRDFGDLTIMDKKAAIKAINLTADLLELLGETDFRVSAYRRAARGLDGIDWEQAKAADFRGVAGLGPQLAPLIREFAESGVFLPLENAASQVPAGVLTLFHVRGLGPKKIRALWDGGIHSLSALIKAGEAGQLGQLKGFGAATATKIVEAARFVITSNERCHRSTAVAIFEHLKALLAPVATQIEMAGSLRRGLETIGDIDIVVQGNETAVLTALSAYSPVSDQQYPWLFSFSVADTPVQLAIGTPEQYGTTLAIMTGPKTLVQTMQKQAMALGLTLDSRGIAKNNLLLPTTTEAECFEMLNLPYTIPEWREPEHQATANPPNPAELVTVAEITSMLHVHSTWSDGSASIEAMALASKALGCRTIGICDHSQLAFYAGGLTTERVRAQWSEIEALEIEGIRILKGIECDIHSDGSLDYDEELLAGFDFVVASIHSAFGLGQAEQTKRLIRAVSNPFTTILGHPTGRLLLRRPEYAFDKRAVLEAAAASRTVIEINANAYRLDLDWRDVLANRDLITGHGLRYAINTDAHSIEGLRDLQYGVAVARKAMLTAEEVVNCWDIDDLLGFKQK
jgi:DNA polymerase (family X)